MKKRSGMNLIEIMLAVAILALTILPVVGLLDYTNRGSREQDAEGIAANLAKEEMNRLMYVIDRENLIDGSPGVKQWSFGGAHNVKGNEFYGEYRVYKHANSSLSFQVPQMNFHDPLECPTGAEANTGVNGTPIALDLETVYPGSPTLLVDIILKVKWKTPSRDFEPHNEITLVGRRAFLVRN